MLHSHPLEIHVSFPGNISNNDNSQVFKCFSLNKLMKSALKILAIFRKSKRTTMEIRLGILVISAITPYRPFFEVWSPVCADPLSEIISTTINSLNSNLDLELVKPRTSEGPALAGAERGLWQLSEKLTGRTPCNSRPAAAR